MNRQRMIMSRADEERRRAHAEEIASKFMTEPDGDHRRYYNTVVTKEQKDREKLVEEGDQLDVQLPDSEYSRGYPFSLATRTTRTWWT